MYTRIHTHTHTHNHTIPAHFFTQLYSRLSPIVYANSEIHLLIGSILCITLPDIVCRTFLIAGKLAPPPLISFLLGIYTISPHNTHEADAGRCVHDSRDKKIPKHMMSRDMTDHLKKVKEI